jgi:hypothetical protein
MMMKMLEAGGMPILTDHVRTADEDNPEGYYEFEQVKQIETDQSWLPDARGKAVKMISALLEHLPSNHAYRVIFMQRTLEEVLASQKQMLIRRGKPAGEVPDEQMAVILGKHLAAIEAWLDVQENFSVLYASYNQTLENPLETARSVNRFLGGHLDEQAMAAVVDPELYRQRRARD